MRDVYARYEVQKLIDAAFEIALLSREHSSFKGLTRDAHMKWVADQLRALGFPTTPMGLSWGVLGDDTDASDDDEITILEPARER